MIKSITTSSEGESTTKSSPQKSIPMLVGRSSRLSVSKENSAIDRIAKADINASGFTTGDMRKDAPSIDERCSEENILKQTPPPNTNHDSNAIQPLCLSEIKTAAPGRTVDENSNENYNKNGASESGHEVNGSQCMDIIIDVPLNLVTAARSKLTDIVSEDKKHEVGSKVKHNLSNGTTSAKETLVENGIQSNSLTTIIEEFNDRHSNYNNTSSVATITSNSTNKQIEQSSINNTTTTNILSNFNNDFMVEPQTSKNDQILNKPNSVRKRVAALCSDPLNFDLKKTKVDIFTETTGPKWYNAESCTITKSLLPKKLTEAFSFLPNYGKPTNPNKLQEFLDQKVQEFVGSGLTNDEFEKLQKYCSENRLKTGKEAFFKMSLGSINQGFVNEFVAPSQDCNRPGGYKLNIIKKHKIRSNTDIANTYTKKLKYRGARILPMVPPDSDGASTSAESDLQPGQDLIFIIRIYRPFTYLNNRISKGRVNTRHSLFSRNMVLLGRQYLTEFRDRIICPNDIDMRIDVSDRMDEPLRSTAKELFPSGFLFINNVFYVDTRAGCHDTSARVRQWAATRPGLGHFPVRDMGKTRLADLVLKLGHPEVYIHQGNCEHLFTFSDIRLLSPYDPLTSSHYPCHTAVAQNATIYCTSCAEFPAKWIATESERVPFDPAYFCETCLKLYLYKNGKKIGNFKTYSYRGNEINMLKPQG